MFTWSIVVICVILALVYGIYKYGESEAKALEGYGEP